MIASFPAGGVIAAVIMVWLGTTASAGQHARPGWAARLWARLCPPGPDVRDDQRRPVRWPASSRIGESREDFWRRIGDGDQGDDSAAEIAITAEEWAAAMLHARMPHLFSTDWLGTQLADHTAWAFGVWNEIRKMRREAGITE